MYWKARWTGNFILVTQRILKIDYKSTNMEKFNQQVPVGLRTNFLWRLQEYGRREAQRRLFENFQGKIFFAHDASGFNEIIERLNSTTNNFTKGEITERCPRGRRGSPAKRVSRLKRDRGFKSLSLRHEPRRVHGSPELDVVQGANHTN